MHLECTFCEAHDDFVNTETGQGLQENDPPEFNATVQKIVHIILTCWRCKVNGGRQDS